SPSRRRRSCASRSRSAGPRIAAPGRGSPRRAAGRRAGPRVAVPGRGSPCRAAGRHAGPRIAAPGRGSPRRTRRVVPRRGELSGRAHTGSMTDDRATLLLVEDDPVVRTFLADNLTADGYSMLVAGTVRDALRTLEYNRPDLAVLDLGLPDGSGLD